MIIAGKMMDKTKFAMGEMKHAPGQLAKEIGPKYNIPSHECTFHSMSHLVTNQY
jgi:hypothetical protein